MKVRCAQRVPTTEHEIIRATHHSYRTVSITDIKKILLLLCIIFWRRCDYMGPGPRAGTGKHRYIYLLYQSIEKVKQENIFVDIPQRRKFPLEKFVCDNHLQLIDLTFFTLHA
ncbi:unnamed protein product [Rotaria sp. Silwood2]|nr:unnamed protein product [Rotaria sp. Silwood2]